MPNVFLILDNIRSVHNVGSIFRTAETIGVSKIYCLGTTPTPIDRFGRKRKDFAKVSLGAEDMVEWEYAEDGLKLIRELKKEGFYIISVEQAEDSIDYRKVKPRGKPRGKSAFIFGNEVDGVGQGLIDGSDIVAEIPMLGKKESLNVSISVAVILFGISGR